MTCEVLVTGGAGYIGSHAVLALIEAGYSPFVIDDFSTGVPEAVPAGVKVYEGDVADAAFVGRVLDERRPTCVMHFAGSILVWESMQDPARYFANNTAATLTLIKAMVERGGGDFIFSSTAAVYGVPDRHPVTEDTPKAPISPYGLSKLMSEQMIAEIGRAHPEFRSVCLRYFNVAGADPLGRSGQRGEGSTHLIRVATEVGLGIREEMELFGDDYDTRDGTCERDFIHVSDLASAHVAALEYLRNGGAPATFNCGYGVGYTVKEVLAALQPMVERPIRYRRSPRRAGDAAQVISEPSAMRAALNWSPRHDDLTTILRTGLAWRRAQQAARRRRPDGPKTAVDG